MAAIALPVLIRRVRYAGRTRPPIAPWPAAKPQLRCVECGAEGDGAAEGWKTYLTDDDPPEAVTQGKLVFADNCAACHSSKAPQQPARANPAPQRRPD